MHGGLHVSHRRRSDELRLVRARLGDGVFRRVEKRRSCVFLAVEPRVGEIRRRMPGALGERLPGVEEVSRPRANTRNEPAAWRRRSARAARARPESSRPWALQAARSSSRPRTRRRPGILELAGVDEGADLVVLLGPLGDRDSKLAPQGDQAVAGEDFQDAPLGKIWTLHSTL